MPSTAAHFTSHELAWFEAGEAVHAGNRNPARFPPLDDPQAQRWWLGGFLAAWVEIGAEDPASRPSPADDPLAALCRDDAHAALAVALSAHPQLAEQLFSGLPAANAARH